MKAPKKNSRSRGYVMIDVLLSLSLMLYALTQFGSLWVSTNAWVTAMRGRAALDREARVAREFLLASWMRSQSVTGGTDTMSVMSDLGKLSEYERSDDMLRYQSGSTKLALASHLGEFHVDVIDSKNTRGTFNFEHGEKSSTLRMWVSSP